MVVKTTAWLVFGYASIVVSNMLEETLINLGIDGITKGIIIESMFVRKVMF